MTLFSQHFNSNITTLFSESLIFIFLTVALILCVKSTVVSKGPQWSNQPCLLHWHWCWCISVTWTKRNRGAKEPQQLHLIIISFLTCQLIAPRLPLFPCDVLNPLERHTNLRRVIRSVFLQLALSEHCSNLSSSQLSVFLSLLFSMAIEELQEYHVTSWESHWSSVLNRVRNEGLRPVSILCLL